MYLLIVYDSNRLGQTIKQFGTLWSRIHAHFAFSPRFRRVRFTSAFSTKMANFGPLFFATLPKPQRGVGGSSVHALRQRPSLGDSNEANERTSVRHDAGASDEASTSRVHACRQRTSVCRATQRHGRADEAYVTTPVLLMQPARVESMLAVSARAYVARHSAATR